MKFKTYKQALKFLMFEVGRKTQLSNYKPTDIELALFTIFKSKTFRDKFSFQNKKENGEICGCDDFREQKK